MGNRCSIQQSEEINCWLEQSPENRLYRPFRYFWATLYRCCMSTIMRNCYCTYFIFSSEEGFIMVKLHKTQSNRHNINNVTVDRSLKSIGINLKRSHILQCSYNLSSNWLSVILIIFLFSMNFKFIIKSFLNSENREKELNCFGLNLHNIILFTL